jgi:hypothetical protein
VGFNLINAGYCVRKQKFSLSGFIVKKKKKA